MAFLVGNVLFVEEAISNWILIVIVWILPPYEYFWESGHTIQVYLWGQSSFEGLISETNPGVFEAVVSDKKVILYPNEIRQETTFSGKWKMKLIIWLKTGLQKTKFI